MPTARTTACGSTASPCARPTAKSRRLTSTPSALSNWSEPMSSPDRETPSVGFVALCGWLIPGGGYWILGERARAMIVAVCVLAVFAMGVLIGGIRVVDAPNQIGVGQLLDKP